MKQHNCMSAACAWAGKVTDPSEINDGEWGSVYGRPHFRPPGTPRALPLSPQHKVFIVQGRPTVEPSIHYDPGGPWEWHGWLRDGIWDGPQGEKP